MKKKLFTLIVLFLFLTQIRAQDVPLPSSFSYVKYVTNHVIDQQVNGPCYAYATIAGVEAMYKLYFKEEQNFNEKQLYACYYSGVANYLEAIHNYGCIEGSNNGSDESQPPKGAGSGWFVVDNTYCEEVWKGKKKRFKVNYIDVWQNNMTIEKYKKLILKYGPIIIQVHENGNSSGHGVLLHGWNPNGWIIKSSGPDGVNPLGYDTFYNYYKIKIEKAYVITEVKEDHLKDDGSWEDATPEIEPFTLDYPGGEVIKLNKPSGGVTIGKYSLSGLDNIEGAVVQSWEVDKSGVNLNVASDKKSCNITGNATKVTLTIKIERVNGLVEKFSYNLGTVSSPCPANDIPLSVSVVKEWSGCVGNTYEADTRINHTTVSGYSYSYKYNIPPLGNNGYVINYGGPYAHWVIKEMMPVNYSVSVTYSKTGCSPKTVPLYTYMIPLPCGSGYSSYMKTTTVENPNENAENVSNFFENTRPFISPNPASQKVIVQSLDDGRNTIKIYDLTGKMIYNKQFESSLEIELSAFKKGIYMVECFSNNTKSLYKRDKLIVK